MLSTSEEEQDRSLKTGEETKKEIKKETRRNQILDVL